MKRTLGGFNPWWIAGPVLALVSAFVVNGLSATNCTGGADPSWQAKEQAAMARAARENTVSAELRSLHYEYLHCQPGQQAAWRALILQRAADYDPATVPADMRDFVAKLK